MPWNFGRRIQRQVHDYSGALSQVFYAFVNAVASGNTQIVAGQGGLRIVVLECCIITSVGQSVKFQSAANDISCAWPLATNGGLVLPFSAQGWLQTNIGGALNVHLSHGG